MRRSRKKAKTTKEIRVMNKTNIKQQLRRTLSALVVIGALFTLPKAQADPPVPAHGYSNDCENLISMQHHGPNTIILLSITAAFTGTFDGTWAGTERDVIHADGSGMVHGSGVFSGSVNVNGSIRSGTMTFSYVVIFPPNGTEVTHWVVDQGTGDLAGIHGQGTTPNDEETGPTEDCPWDTFLVEYDGQIQFGP
jgi:Protein of unknown function (DUF3224)